MITSGAQALLRLSGADHEKPPSQKSRDTAYGAMTSVDTWGVNVPMPPAGFDLDKASDEKRAKHGIPRVHRLPQLEQRLVETTRGTRFVAPKLEPCASVRPKRIARRPRRTAKIEAEWPSTTEVGCCVAASGFTTDMPAIDSFAAVHGEFNVPTVWPAQIWETPGQEWLVAPKVGLGGGVAGGCPQVGVKCGVTDTTGNYDLQWDYRPWFEWYPYPAVYLTSAGLSTVKPGGDAAPLARRNDTFAVTIVYLPWALPDWGTPHGHEVLAVITNQTQGWTSVLLARQPEEGFHGYDAGWVVDVNGSSPGFPIVDSVQFSNCQALTKAGTVITPGSSNDEVLVNLVRSNGENLATATQNIPDGIRVLTGPECDQPINLRKPTGTPPGVCSHRGLRGEVLQNDCCPDCLARNSRRSAPTYGQERLVG
jgi:hypothetical protein